MLSVHQRYRQTDGHRRTDRQQTDGQLTIAIPPFVLHASRGKKEKKNRRLRVTISRMRRHAPFEPTNPNTCMWAGVPDVSNHAKCFENRRKGFGADRPRNMAFPFPIDFAGRPYNTLTLPCERVMWVPAYVNVRDKFYCLASIFLSFYFSQEVLSVERGICAIAQL